MEPNELTAVILGIIGILSQLIMKYAPKISDWYLKQSEKGLIMLGVILVVSAGYFAVSCVPDLAVPLHVSLSCNKSDLVELLKVVFYIASSNQLTFLLTKS